MKTLPIRHSIPRPHGSAVVALMTAFISSLTLAPLTAAQWTVTNLANAGGGSLRDTIVLAANGDTIRFGVTGTITLSAELVVNKSVAITGPGANALTVSGNNVSRVFRITAPNVSITGLRIANGQAPNTFNGGGVRVEAPGASFTNCVFASNRAGATAADGGAIGVMNANSAVIHGCTFVDNQAENGGAVSVSNDQGRLLAVHCTMTGNRATLAAGRGGAVHTLGTVTLVACTIVSNVAPDVGGVFRQGSRPVTLSNCVIAANSGTAVPDVNGLTSGGFNLIGAPATGSIWLFSDRTGTTGTPLDPRVGPLTDNGGTTPTMLPLPGSPALEAGNDSIGLATDQRGLPRLAGCHVDIGAVEAAAPAGPPISVALASVTHPKTYRVRTLGPTNDSFSALARCEIIQRAPVAGPVSLRLNYRLLDANGTEIALRSNVATQEVVLQCAGTTNFGVLLPVAPLLPLNSVTNTYRVSVQLSHRETSVGTFSADNLLAAPPERFVDFSGRIFFGPRRLEIIAMNTDPLVGAPTATSLPMALRQTRLQSPFAAALVTPSTNISGVRLLPNGDVTNNGASLTVAAVGLAAGNAAGVQFTRTSIALTPTGIAANDLTVLLPTGLGYNLGSVTAPSGRILRSKLAVPSALAELDDFLRPVQTTIAFDPPTGSRFYFSEETKPIWIPSDRVTWLVVQGRFEVIPVAGALPYVREEELATLAAMARTIPLPVTNPDSLVKRSNDRYYQGTRGNGSLFSVRAGASGEALLAGSLTFAAQTFQTHFPFDNQVNWIGGSVVVSNDLFAVGTTVGVLGVQLDYAQDCLKTGPCVTPTNGLDHLAVTADDQRLGMTKDGGLVGGVRMFNPNPLEWGSRGRGEYAHAHKSSFTTAAYHLPGTFLRGDQSSIDATLRPGFMLLSGFGSAGDLGYEERPETGSYQNAGLANYAGLNFRVGNGGMETHSRLGGSPVDYALTPRSKYYARYGGISGIHEPKPDSFPTTLEVYGYPFRFTSFGVSFLDNDVADSIIDGSLFIKYPSKFTQEFARLTLSCQGDFDSADVPANAPLHDLKYWDGQFRTMSMSFEASTNCTNGRSEIFLTLGVQTSASHIAQPLLGTLGFTREGNLVTAIQGVPGVNSRFALPANITLRRNDQEAYQITTVGQGYFNNHDTYSQQEDSGLHGWFNVAGKMNLPFFEDARVHLHTQAKANDTNSGVFVMGGWAAKDRPRLEDRGWTNAAGAHFFNTVTNPALFDLNNDGYPANDPGGVGPGNVAAYREGGSEDYLPRAQQTWLGNGLITFDYPLAWSKSLRTFASLQGQSQDLGVMKIESQVKRMTPRTAEITFGAEYSGLPKINLAGLALDAINDATGLLNSVREAAGDAATSVLDAGLNGLDTVLKDRMEDLLREVMFNSVPGQESFDQTVDQLYAALRLAADAGAGFGAGGSGGSGGSGTGGGALNDLVQEKIREQLIARLASLANSAPAGPLLQKLNAVLTDVDGALGTILLLTARDINGKRTIAHALTKELVKDEWAEFAAVVADYNLISPALESAGPTFDDILTRAQDIRNRIHQVQSELNGAWQQELAELIKGFSEPFILRVEEKIVRFINENPLPKLPGSPALPDAPRFQPAAGFVPAIPTPPTDLFAEKLKAFVRQTVIEEIAATPISAAIQVSIKQRLQDLNASLRETIDTFFQQINGVIRDALNGALGKVDDSINGFVGKLGDKLGSGKIQGYASINDDGLRKLRLDGKFRMGVPDPMEFAGWMEFEQLDSKGTPNCDYGGGASVCEIRLGADNIPISWGKEKCRLKVCAKFTADDNIRGMAGCLELKGKMKFEVVEVNELLATVAFGADEGYFGARCRAKLGDFEVAGGLWFGRACSLDPLLLIDKDVGTVLPSDGGIVGGYAYAEGWVPVNPWIGIPSTCLLDIKAGIGAGIFFFESGSPPIRTYGGKMLLGADIDLLCIANAHGEIRLVGAKSGDELKLFGAGDFSLEIGSCPFCLEFSKSVGLHYGSRAGWDVDF